MSVLRQKLLTDFFRSPEKCYETGAATPLLNINCESHYVVDPCCENELRKPLSPAENYPSSVSSTTVNSSKVIRTIIISGKEKRKRRLLMDDPKQMVLDAGQKQFGHWQCKQVSF